jgi:hypothetical protein
VPLCHVVLLCFRFEAIYGSDLEKYEICTSRHRLRERCMNRVQIDDFHIGPDHFVIRIPDRHLHSTSVPTMMNHPQRACRALNVFVPEDLTSGTALNNDDWTRTIRRCTVGKNDGLAIDSEVPRDTAGIDDPAVGQSPELAKIFNDYGRLVDNGHG